MTQRTGSDVTIGLTTARAADILHDVGSNRLPDPPARPVWDRVLSQVRDPMILLLVAAAVLASVLGDWASTVIIALVVVFNTGVGVFQELRAEKAMAALHQMVAPEATALRDGVWTTLTAAEVVPQDVVRIVAGDVVPADGELLEANDLQLDEAAMTGESLPVLRTVGEEVTGGTLVTRGRAVLVITRTGAQSGIGRIAALLGEERQRRTPLQRRLARLSRTLVLTISALTLLVVTLGLVQGRPISEMVIVGLSLAVAAVPESLPAVVTVALALGAHRMATRNAVVSSLPAVETLGSVTVVATDKTGTVTEGVMVAEHVWTPGESYVATAAGYAPDGEILTLAGAPTDSPALRRLLRDALLCNDAELRPGEDGTWSVAGDPLEGALLALAAKGLPSVDREREAWPRVGEEPFDQQTMRMQTRHRHSSGRELSVVKGAPESVLSILGDAVVAAAATTAAEEFAGEGLRVLAIADDESGGLTLAGLVAVGDPPRAHAAHVVERLRAAGIRVVLVTGDHARTAHAIAARVGIATQEDGVVEGGNLNQHTDLPHDVTVVARVRPEQKVLVVEALQGRDEVVAMLGDGVNDAPALRRADIGVAAGLGGTEVARQAADLVLMDDDFKTVVAAVEEGRRIFTNIRSFLVYAISGGLAEVGVMLVGPAVGLALPLLPAQILWINLLTHGLTGVAFGGEPADPRDMERDPRPPGESVFTPRSKVALAIATVMLVATSMVTATIVAAGVAETRTATFLGLGLAQLGVALALRARSGGRTLRERGLELALVSAAALMLTAVYVPGLQTLLDTRALPLGVLLPVAAAAVLPGIVVRLAMREPR